MVIATAPYHGEGRAEDETIGRARWRVTTTVAARRAKRINALVVGGSGSDCATTMTALVHFQRGFCLVARRGALLVSRRLLP